MPGTASGVSTSCGIVLSADTSALPVEIVTMQGRGLVLLLVFKSAADMQRLADGLKDLGIRDAAFREAALGVNFAGEPGGTRLVAEFPGDAPERDVCMVYTLLRPHAVGLVDTFVVDTRG